jgi:hypothetical protein
LLLEIEMQTTFVNQPMAFAKKHKTVFYYGEGEGVEAKRLADMERAAGMSACRGTHRPSTARSRTATRW